MKNEKQFLSALSQLFLEITREYQLANNEEAAHFALGMSVNIHKGFSYRPCFYAIVVGMLPDEVFEKYIIEDKSVHPDVSGVARPRRRRLTARQKEEREKNRKAALKYEIEAQTMFFESRGYMDHRNRYVQQYIRDQLYETFRHYFPLPRFRYIPLICDWNWVEDSAIIEKQKLWHHEFLGDKDFNYPDFIHPTLGTMPQFAEDEFCENLDMIELCAGQQRQLLALEMGRLQDIFTNHRITYKDFQELDLHPIVSKWREEGEDVLFNPTMPHWFKVQREWPVLHIQQDKETIISPIYVFNNIILVPAFLGISPIAMASNIFLSRLDQALQRMERARRGRPERRDPRSRVSFGSIIYVDFDKWLDNGYTYLFEEIPRWIHRYIDSL